MRETLKSGLSLLLSGIVLGSTFLAGCKKERIPTEKDNVSMWAKVDGKKEASQVQVEKQAVKEKNSKEKDPFTFYMDQNKYQDSVTSTVFGEEVVTSLAFINQSNPRGINMNELTFNMNIYTKEKSKLRFLPLERYFISSQKLENIRTRDFQLKEVQTLRTSLPDLISIINKNPQTKKEFGIKESEIYKIESPQEREIINSKKELTAQEFSQLYKNSIFLRQKQQSSMKELFSAVISTYKIKNKEGNEAKHTVCMQIPTSPPFFPEYEGYWLDEQAKEIFCITRKEILKTNTLYIRDTQRNVSYTYFNQTARLAGDSTIQLDPTKTKDSLVFKDNEITYIKDKKPIKLKRISEETAYTY